MKRLHGVKAPHWKHTQDLAAVRIPVPPEVIIPMSMHIGAPAECLVQVGDEVNEGMLIGKAAGFISANIYCSVKGVVKEIKDIYLASGMKTKAVVVETAEDFKPGEVKFEASDWEKLTPKEIMSALSPLLPRYMWPARLEKMEELPYTGSGKIDRQALKELL